MNRVNIVLSIVLLLNVLALMYTIYMTISDKKEMLKGDYIIYWRCIFISQEYYIGYSGFRQTYFSLGG
jgi:hypothetical protein